MAVHSRKEISLKKRTLIMDTRAARITTPAQAMGMIAGATFPEQIMQELTLAEQYATQAHNLQNMPQQLWSNAAAPRFSNWSSL